MNLHALPREKASATPLHHHFYTQDDEQFVAIWEGRQTYLMLHQELLGRQRIPFMVNRDLAQPELPPSEILEGDLLGLTELLITAEVGEEIGVRRVGRSLLLRMVGERQLVEGRSLWSIVVLERLEACPELSPTLERTQLLTDLMETRAELMKVRDAAVEILKTLAYQNPAIYRHATECGVELADCADEMEPGRALSFIQACERYFKRMMVT